MLYELRLERFSGPLDKLLELIEGQKLEITEISLATVTDDFLKYVKTLETVETPLLADFVAIASKLIFIKSKFILPDFRLTGEEEAEIRDLEKRLRMYRELRPAMHSVQRLWREGSKQFGRPYFMNVTVLDASKSGEKIFYPGLELTSKRIMGALGSIIDGFKKLELETRTIREKIITIEEKMAEIIHRLEQEVKTTLKTLSHKKPVSEVIAVFLAILHLAREQKVFLDQKTNFSDIIIKTSH